MSSAYCVDCYAIGGCVTVATRKFKDDDLCERHYRELCKELEIEPEPLPSQPVQSVAPARPLAERAAASPRAPRLNKASAKAEERVSAVASRGVLAPKADSRSPRFTPPATAENGEGVGKRPETRRAGSSDFPTSRSPDIPISSNASQRPDSSVVPTAEGLKDRAHSPTPAAPSKRSGVSQAPSAVSPQPSKRMEPSMKKVVSTGDQLRNADGKRVCSCGCGTELHSRHPYIKGHNTTPGKSAAPGAKKASTNGHAAAVPALANGNVLHAMPRDSVVMCPVSELSMDRIWSKLNPEEKAQLLFPQEIPQNA